MSPEHPHRRRWRLETILTARPVDRTAREVTSPGPTGYESTHKITSVHSATPLPMRAVPPHSPDLSGLRCGRLVVVGLARKPGRWVCRCVCGYYTLRRPCELRARRGRFDDSCERCRHVDGLRGFDPRR